MTTTPTTAPASGASGTALRWAFDDSRITQHLLALAIADAGAWESARREIGEYMLGEIQDCFDGQKLFDGRPMPQSQAAIDRSGRTLIDKHRLYDSYVYQLPAHGIEFGSALVYAAIHHFGGETGRPGHRFNMTARPVMGMTDRHERRIGSELIAEIERTQR